MTTTDLPATNDALIAPAIAEKVLTVGPEHIHFKGGIGYLMNVYARHFAVFKCINSHKPVSNKLALIPYFIRQYARFIGTLLTDRQIDIIHMHASSHGSFYRKFLLFITARYAFGKQTIYHMNGSRFAVFYDKADPITRWMIRFLVEHVDMVLCLSPYWYDFFSQNFRVRRLEQLGNVIHSDRLLTDSVRHRQSGQPLTFLFLGAIGHRKGVFDLLDVLRTHRDTLEGRMRLLIGGDGETERLETYLRDHKLENLATFEGWVSGEKKQQLLASADVYILPSYNEGLPLSILEAMNYKLPVISTPVGGTAEAVHDGINGFLVQPGDRVALYNCLMTFINQPELIEQMGAESGRLVSQYHPDVIMPRLNVMYESLLHSTVVNVHEVAPC